ncbi:hypothetical protein ACWV95_24055 [Streptomyces albus]
MLGTSSGGITAVELLVRHQDRVRLAVAHEPPLARVLPEPQAALAGFAEAARAAAREGAGAGYARLGAAPSARRRTRSRTRTRARPAPLPDALRETVEASSAHFLRHVLRPFTHHEPDLAALKAVADRLVVGVGRTSRGQLQHTIATTLAGAVGAECRQFPGGHLGSVEHPSAFARVLEETLLAAGPAAR